MSVRHYNQKRDSKSQNRTSVKFNSEWIKIGIDEDAIEYAKEKGKDLFSKRLTTTQIRNVFGEMRRIQMNGFDKEKTSFLLLRPKLAYTAKRHKNAGVEEFFRIFEKASNQIELNSDKSSEQYQNMMDIFEAILAYHKYFGGSEN